jgi:uncharacterized protein (UPF0276 family)
MRLIRHPPCAPDKFAPYNAVGIGLKGQHGARILEGAAAVDFFEVHAENYMGAGGPPHRLLTAIRERYPVTLHGVGLSIGGSERLDRDHMMRLRDVADRYEPFIVSEHLAWSSYNGAFHGDLLPIPYNEQSLARVARHVDEVQAFLKRKILIENPSAYVRFAESDIAESEFLHQLVRRTGCGLLLDVNNVMVSCTNHGLDPQAYLDAFPTYAIGQFHLAGHDVTRDSAGYPLLIDAHGSAVASPVWTLFERAVSRAGIHPTLIEWDNNVPTLDALVGEASIARTILDAHHEREAAFVHA